MYLLTRGDEIAVAGIVAVVRAAVLGVGGGQEVDVQAAGPEEAPSLGHVEPEVVGYMAEKVGIFQ